MDSIRDLMQAKADELDVDTKRDEIALIQEVLDRHFPDQTTVQKVFDDGGVLVHVSSAPLASEVRLRSQSLLQEIQSSLQKKDIKRIITKVAKQR